MIQEGHVRVVWINSNDTIATPRYTVIFACYEPPEEFDAQKSKAIIGEAELLRFLYVININADDLKTGSRVLHERGYVEFASMHGSFGRATCEFRFKVADIPIIYQSRCRHLDGQDPVMVQPINIAATGAARTSNCESSNLQAR